MSKMRGKFLKSESKYRAPMGGVNKPKPRPELILPPSFNLSGTVTGRFSCRDSNHREVVILKSRESGVSRRLLIEAGELVVKDLCDLELRVIAGMKEGVQP